MSSHSLRSRSAVPSLAVTGSKGGVGKSTFAVNLAVALGRTGRRVLVVDGDLGLANLDVLLGLVPMRTVEQLIAGKASLEELLLDGPEGVRVLPATSGVPRLACLDRASRDRFLSELAKGGELADEIILDTGAGLGPVTLSLQMAASRVVIVTTAEPTSLVDTYASIKVLWDVEPAKRIDVVVSNVKDEDEARLAYDKLCTASESFLSRRPGWLGFVVHDPALQRAVRCQRALTEVDPTSPAARCYERIALRLALGPEVSHSDFWQRLSSVAEREIVH